jgi:hypothetical protein
MDVSSIFFIHPGWFGRFWPKAGVSDLAMDVPQLGEEGSRRSGGWLYLFLINRFSSSGLIGAAFGGDTQDAFIGVDRTPPPLPMVQQARIDVVNLGGVDGKVIFESAQDIYQSVLANEAEEGGFGDPDKIWKRLSDALYHNAYMRDETVIATVATFFGVRLLREG